MAKSWVLDTSAVLAVLFDEPGNNEARILLEGGREGDAHIYMPFLALMEVEYLLLRRLPAEQVTSALALVENWPMTLVESSTDWRHKAASVKARGGLSLADSWAASLALSLNAELVHCDGEFDSVPGLMARNLRYA